MNSVVTLPPTIGAVGSKNADHIRMVCFDGCYGIQNDSHLAKHHQEEISKTRAKRFEKVGVETLSKLKTCPSSSLTFAEIQIEQCRIQFCPSNSLFGVIHESGGVSTIDGAYYYMSMIPSETKKKPKQLFISLQGVIARDGSIMINNSGIIHMFTNKLESVPRFSSGGMINQVAACDLASFALDTYGRVWAWGHPSAAGLGRAEGIESLTTPTKIESLCGVQHIAAGTEHAVAVTTSRDVYTWGSVPLCGHGKEKPLLGSCADFIHSPIRVKSLSSIVQVSCGKYNTIVLDTKGQLHAWGSNSHGQLGIGPKRLLEFTHRPFYKTKDTAHFDFAKDFYEAASDDFLDFVDSPKSVRLPRSVEVGQICCADETSLALALDGSVFLWYAYDVIPCLFLENYCHSSNVTITLFFQGA